MQELDGQQKAFLLLGYDLIEPFISYALGRKLVAMHETVSLRDELKDELLRAVETFDPARGAANNYIWTRWLRWVGSRNRHKPWRAKTLQASEFCTKHDDHAVADYKLLMRMLLAAPLSPRKLKVLLSMHLLGLSIRETAKLLRMSSRDIVKQRQLAVEQLQRYVTIAGLGMDDFMTSLDQRGNVIEEI